MTLFVAFLSGTSALLIVAHLKGKELHLRLYRLVAALYVVATAFFLVMYAKTLEGALDVRAQMHVADLDWFNAAYEPQIIAPLVFSLGFVVQLMLAIGSLWYLRSTRKS